MTLYCQFYKRGSLGTVTLRGDVFEAISAEGGETDSSIGYGKVSIPLYDNFRRPFAEQVQPGDLALAWSTAPYLDAKRPLMVACFLVETRQSKEDTRYEVSGPDILAELLEFYAIAPIGSLAEVVVTAMSIGQTTVNHPPPQDDTYLTLEAAYPMRAYLRQDVTHEGATHILFSDATTAQETDTFRYVFADGEVFTTIITSVSPRRTSVFIADPLPQDLPATVGRVEIWSTRLRVDDARDLTAGSHIFYTPGVAPGNSNPRPVGNLLVDRIELGSDGNQPDYIYTADPIADYIDEGAALTQRQYIEPTTADIELLFMQSTSTVGSPAQWSVIRSPLATQGTVYAPDRESVWDVLLAISGMTGYQFRKYFRGLPTLNAWSHNPFAEWRSIEYFPAGSPVVAGELSSITTATTIATNHATILRPIQAEDAGAAVTTLFPFGGGAGTFDFRQASIGTVLDEFNGVIGWGIINNQYYVYNKTLVNAGARLVDAVETFSHIAPVNDTPAARKEAAEQLLRAACEWLLLHDEPQVTYVVDVFTIGEPRPGDVVTLTYHGDSPHPTIDSPLIITEVVHRVEPDPGYRVTTLALNKSAFKVMNGPRLLAKEIDRLRGGVQGANTGGRGTANLEFDRLGFGKDGIVTAETGNMYVSSSLGDVTVSAGGDVYIDGDNIAISGAVAASGVIRGESGLALPDNRRPNDWVLGVRNVRGIPRIAQDWKEPPA